MPATHTPYGPRWGIIIIWCFFCWLFWIVPVTRRSTCWWSWGGQAWWSIVVVMPSGHRSATWLWQWRVQPPCILLMSRRWWMAWIKTERITGCGGQSWRVIIPDRAVTVISLIIWVYSTPSVLLLWRLGHLLLWFILVLFITFSVPWGIVPFWPPVPQIVPMWHAESRTNNPQKVWKTKVIFKNQSIKLVMKSTKGVNQSSKDATWTQHPRPKSPTVTVTWCTIVSKIQDCAQTPSKVHHLNDDEISYSISERYKLAKLKNRQEACTGCCAGLYKGLYCVSKVSIPVGCTKYYYTISKVSYIHVWVLGPTMTAVGHHTCMDVDLHPLGVGVAIYIYIRCKRFIHLTIYINYHRNRNVLFQLQSIQQFKQIHVYKY